jgi:hypothetical protein
MLSHWKRTLSVFLEAYDVDELIVMGHLKFEMLLPELN